jgi:hypothetical protein
MDPSSSTAAAAGRRPVHIEIPPELFDGDTRGFLQHLGLHGRHLMDNDWSIRADAGPKLVTSMTLADETGFDHKFDVLAQLPNIDAIVNDPSYFDEWEQLGARLMERFLTGNDETAYFNSIQGDMLRAKASDLPSWADQIYTSLGERKLESTGEALFANRSAHLVCVTDTLVRRARLPAMLFRFAQDPDAFANLKLAEAQGDPLFATSTPWYLDIIGGIHYLGPLFGCRSPLFWCIPAPRQMATILFSLGHEVNGYRREPMEPMQLLPSLGRRDSREGTKFDVISTGRAIHWWAFRLNQMFTYLSDSATFSDPNGWYSPHDHQHWMLTFGQAFGLVTSIQTSGRNRATQLALMYTLLDTIADRLSGRSFDDLCSLKTAQKVARRVREGMYPPVAEVLMPAADRAVAALAELQEGFFIQRQRGEEEVVFHMPGGKTDAKTPEKAVALLLKVFRNATHGFGGKKGDNAGLFASILVQHNGQLPEDIVLLPYLYLLEVLCYPNDMRRRITGGAT